jgi:hypothetical protein
MLELKYREILMNGHKRFEMTKDRTHIDDAINLVMTMSPGSFFNGPKDKALEQRVFVHAPRGAYWSGTARTYKDAYPVENK